MQQGGYVSSSSAKTLTVSKKSNVLDKIPPRGPKSNSLNSNSTNNNNNNISTITSSIDVSDKILAITVCHEHNSIKTIFSFLFQ